MRQCLLFFLVLFSLAVVAQQDSTSDKPLVIKHIPPEGMVLDKGWKFQAGDNKLWAKREYDDRQWPVTNIDKPIGEFLQTTRGSVVWLRLHFTHASGSNDTLLTLLIEQHGASEVYFNGKLIQRYGNIGSSKNLKPYNPHAHPVPISLAEEPIHTLAIRFALASPPTWIVKRTNIPPLSVRLQALPNVLTRMKDAPKQSRFHNGELFITGIVGLLFLLLFLLYPQQRLNLYFSLFNICLVLNSLIGIYLQEGQYTLTQRYVLSSTGEFLNRATGMSVAAFISLALFGMVPRWMRWFITYVLTVDILLFVLFPSEFAPASYVSRGFYTLIVMWLTYCAFRSKKTEDKLIGILATGVILINVSYTLLNFSGINLTAYATALNPFLIFPATVIYLALRYASANRLLEQQLVQVKALSDENIQKELEKQLILAEQKQILERQVKERTAALNASLEDLKTTQQQLIQKEKMASLGELTAGIAHEIQNPLNFVNNFSEANAELLAELKQEATTGNTTAVIALAEDLEQNQHKITHHGQRADSIVKGMLQHARVSTGEKQPTHINQLTDEYLRLSYQGMQAKDNSFSVTIQTQFDASISAVNIAPQDIGRVLLNLFNNAFYAVQQKKAELNGTYEPIVSVQTKREDKAIVVLVKDNGMGMPQKVADKVFQPFFTTKPTGEGTGLGLSLSYDIITKGHGGNLTVSSKEGEGSEFVVELPVG